MNNILTQKLKNFLQAINLDNLEKFFFALFLLSTPFQTRLTFTTPQTYFNGSFNEYATFFLYLSDILFIITFFAYFVNLCYKYNDLTKTNNFSIKAYILNLFHTYPRLIPTWTLLITLITWSFASILWSEYKNLAFYQSFKILELALLFFYVCFRLQWFGFNKLALMIFVAGSFESIIGIAQYYLQRSLGLKLLMESVLSPEIPNVAKIVIDGERIIRAYGTFPHPNVFSGFLILSIFCGFWLLKSKLFHVKQFMPQQKFIKLKIVSRLPLEATTINTQNNANSTKHIVSRETIFTKAKWGETILSVLLVIGLITQLAALIFTFSRSGWLASIIILIIFILLAYKSKLFHVKQLAINSKIFLLAFSACWQIWQDKHLPLEASVINAQNNTNNVNEIVSRETIYPDTKEGETISNMTKTYKTTLLTIAISLLCIISINYKQIINRTNGLQDSYQQSIDNRNLYNNISLNIIGKHPMTGIGNKNFTLQIQEFTSQPLEWWQFQPAHNIYLLIASELGITGLALFIIFLYFIIKPVFKDINDKIVSRAPFGSSVIIAQNNINHVKENVSRETFSSSAKEVKTINNINSLDQIVSRVSTEYSPINTLSNTTSSKQNVSRETLFTTTDKDEETNNTKSLKQIVSRETILVQKGLLSILIGFLFIGLFDHYFWTLQQGQLTFWLLLGTIASLKK